MIKWLRNRPRFSPTRNSSPPTAEDYNANRAAPPHAEELSQLDRACVPYFRYALGVLFSTDSVEASKL